MAANPSGQDWNDNEIDLIVADYFDMLRMELAGQPFVKSHRNTELQRIIGRTRGSIEFKHQNISAVLLRLGMPWIEGYKPLANFQNALIEGIGRYLAEKGASLEFASPPKRQALQREYGALHEESTLFVGPPPTLTAPPSDTPLSLDRLIKKFDPATRDEQNRKLGRDGESLIYANEKARLKSAGRSDLADKVRWISEDEGDGAGFDILSFSNDGRERCLEVKTTIGHQTTPFFLSENERVVATQRPDSYRIMRIWDFARKPKAFELCPPLESHVILRAISYRASFDA
jgi:hypothetical protein